MNNTDLDVRGAKRGEDGAKPNARLSGEIVNGDLTYDGRVILYIIKG